MSMQRYRVSHETSYSYGGDVAHSHQLLHLSPRDTQRQTVRRQAIEIEPLPSSRVEWKDAFGNLTTRLEFDLLHDQLMVRAESDVEVAIPGEDSVKGDAWEAVAGALNYAPHDYGPELLEACRYRMESGYIGIKRRFNEYARECFSAGAPLLEVARALMHKIHGDFEYAPGSTNIRTSALEALHSRRGVCQDFAHVMIACLRSRGLAARYVSGYLRTTPPRGAGPHWQGADASHAWVSVYCPPLGWIDLDPTNDLEVAGGHIVVAWGRDFGDVSPLRGIIVGGGQHRLSVRVSVQPA